MSATETAESTLPTHPKIHDKVLSKNIILYKYMRPQRCVASSRLIHTYVWRHWPAIIFTPTALKWLFLAGIEEADGILEEVNVWNYPWTILASCPLCLVQRTRVYLIDGQLFLFMNGLVIFLYMVQPSSWTHHQCASRCIPESSLRITFFPCISSVYASSENFTKNNVKDDNKSSRNNGDLRVDVTQRSS